MNWRIILAGGAMSIILAGGKLSGDEPAAPAASVSLNHPLPDRALAWDSRAKETNVVGGVDAAHFVFNFTNCASGSVVIQNSVRITTLTGTHFQIVPSQTRAILWH
jgi:hypothetical protein